MQPVYHEVELSVSGLGCDAVSSDSRGNRLPRSCGSSDFCNVLHGRRINRFGGFCRGGSRTLEYQWWVNDVASISGAEILPRNRPDHATTIKETFYYFCEVTQTEEGCGVPDLAQITVVPIQSFHSTHARLMEWIH